MPGDVLMPELSPGMEKGNLVKWLKKEGESFHAGDVLAEVETDKAIMEIAAEQAGTLSRILVAAGTADVPVDQRLAVFAAEGETVEHAAAPAAKTAHGEAAAPPPARRAGRIFASPVARRIARDAGLGLDAIAGSGPGGRIVEKDVRAVQARLPPATKSSTTGFQVSALYAPGSYESIPHDDMRRTVASRLTLAVTTIPQFHLRIDCEIDEALRLRKQVNTGASAPDAAGERIRVSLTDIILKAYAMAFTMVPDANVTWTENALLRHKGVDVALAVALPGNGLITPIVRDVHAKALPAIAAQTRDLVRRARERKLRPEEYRGGTTAVSNLAMSGIRDFTAIVNPPHATILAVGAPRQEALVRKGALVVGSILTVTLTCDHRAVDGELGAKLLRRFKQLLERPAALLE